MDLSYSKKTMIWSLCAALCVALPQTLRVIPNSDAVYMAMHIPVLLCGILCGSGGGLMCALLGCCVSALISGVPTLPMFPVVLLELVLMGTISGAVRRKPFVCKGEKAALYSVLSAVLIGRTAAGVLAAWLFSPGREAMALWVWAYLVAGLPSFIIQLILMPAIIKALECSRLLKISGAVSEAPALDADINEKPELEGTE